MDRTTKTFELLAQAIAAPKEIRHEHVDIMLEYALAAYPEGDNPLQFLTEFQELNFGSRMGEIQNLTPEGLVRIPDCLVPHMLARHMLMNKWQFQMCEHLDKLADRMIIFIQAEMMLNAANQLSDDEMDALFEEIKLELEPFELSEEEMDLMITGIKSQRSSQRS